MPINEFSLTKLERDTLRLMQNKTEVLIGLQVNNIFLALTAIQYAWRDTGLTPPMREIMRDLGNSLGQILVLQDPQAQEIVNAGWNTDLDVPRDKED